MQHTNTTEAIRDAAREARLERDLNACPIGCRHDGNCPNSPDAPECESCGRDPEDCSDDCRCDPCDEARAENAQAAYECGT